MVPHEPPGLAAFLGRVHVIFRGIIMATKTEHATQKQVDYLATLAEKIGWKKAKSIAPCVAKISWSNFQRRWLGKYDMTKGQASNAIDKLLNAN